jgi:replicative DNA helicase
VGLMARGGSSPLRRTSKRPQTRRFRQPKARHRRPPIRTLGPNWGRASRRRGGGDRDAHGVLLLYRDELYGPDTNDAGVLQVDVAKAASVPGKLAAHLETRRLMCLAPDAT